MWGVCGQEGINIFISQIDLQLVFFNPNGMFERRTSVTHLHNMMNSHGFYLGGISAMQCLNSLSFDEGQIQSAKRRIMANGKFASNNTDLL